MQRNRVAVLAWVFAVIGVASVASAQQLEIHYINVGWGGSVLVKGPDGTTVLMEAGNTGKGTAYVVPYLKSIGIQPANGLDYTVAGHQHCDHIGGMDEVINAGYNVRVRNLYNGSSYQSSCATGWAAAAATTTAGALAVPAAGQQIALGNGATLTFVAVNGRIIGGGAVAVSDENDRSIAVLIQYGGFDYIWASDLGGGTIDEACTGRFTSSQTDVETSVITAISPGGAFPLITSGGIDVLHVNHHGSESSTNHNYMNLARPALAIIGVGDGESAGWNLPRIDVVEHVLMAQSASCVTVPPALVLQTEEGNPSGSTTSFAGFNVGDITVTTDGTNGFTVSANGNVHQGINEVALASLPRTIALDDVTTPDTVPPTTAVTAPAGGATVSGSIAVTANASDDRGVVKVEFYLDGALQSTDSAAPYSWTWNTTTASNASHTLTTRAYDAANNVGTSAGVSVTVSNVGGAGLDISGWKIVQANASNTFVVPAGTVIPGDGYLVVGRNATKTAFQTFWHVTLPATAVYINSAGAFPVINGSENYTLYDAAGTKIDGATIGMASGAGQSVQRKDPCLAAGTSSSWNVLASSSGSPGTGAGAGCGKGVVINEFSDALGTGNFVYEFVELHYDKP
jgi:beta-lactamase superfamily II metal-dependent hydrolase